MLLKGGNYLLKKSYLLSTSWYSHNKNHLMVINGEVEQVQAHPSSNHCSRSTLLLPVLIFPLLSQRQWKKGECGPRRYPHRGVKRWRQSSRLVCEPQDNALRTCVPRLKGLASWSALFKNETCLLQGSFVYLHQVREAENLYTKLLLMHIIWSMTCGFPLCTGLLFVDFLSTHPVYSCTCKTLSYIFPFSKNNI